FRPPIRPGVDAVMTAHASFPAIAPTGAPATLSSAIIQGLLERELGFRGAVSTDALNMQAVIEGGGEGPAAAVRALTAGCDALLYPADPAAVAAALEAALGDALPHARAEAALAAIARLRGQADSIAPPAAEWGRPEDHAWALSVADRTLRVVRGEPLRLADAVDLLTVDDDIGGPYPPGPRDAFPAALRAAGADVNEVAAATPGRALIVAVYADIRGWKGRAGLSERAVAAVANALDAAPDATVVLFGHPRLAAELPERAAHVLAAWGGERVMQEAAA